jgi:two-component system NtrC family response regulator
MEKPRILIVDDDDDVRTQMKWALSQDYDVFLAEDRATAVALVHKERPNVVTLDLGLPPSPSNTREGFLALAEMLECDPFLRVVVITGQGEKENGMEAIGQGAFDFFSKPVGLEELRGVLNRAVRVQRLERDRYEEVETEGFDSFEGIIGNSPEIRSVFATIEKVAGSNASVLIVGESGTGKELVARAIHKRSSRNSGPFVPINVGAIPENLLESELFGHEKGAFTGAHIQRQGRIDLAQAGTLFLDEVGELSGSLQVKLLRFLQDHEIERVGGRAPIKVDARVLAATNVDLTKALSEGRFREDLYYRLGVVIIFLPPLRERNGDIHLLSRAFLQRQAAAQKKTLVFTPKAIDAMECHAWPGNVRELENRVQRAAIMAENGKITPSDLALAAAPFAYQGQSLGKAREALDRQLIGSALARNKGNLTRAAAELEISRPSLYELIQKLGIARR